MWLPDIVPLCYIPQLIYVLKTQWQFEEKKEINTALIVYKYNKKKSYLNAFLISVWIFLISVGFGLISV